MVARFPLLCAGFVEAACVGDNLFRLTRSLSLPAKDVSGGAAKSTATVPDLVSLLTGAGR